MFNTKLLRLFNKKICGNIKIINLNKIIYNPNIEKKYTTHVAEILKPYQSIVDRLKLPSENNHAHTILHSLPAYTKTLCKPIKLTSVLDETQFYELLNKNWRSKTATEILKGFLTACNYSRANNIPLTNNCFDKLVDGLMDRCQDLTDSELSDLLSCVREYPLPETIQGYNFHDIWSALDDICLSRHENWTLDELLLFSDHWYLLGLCKYSDFIKATITRLQRRVNTLTAAQLVQTLFLINTHRKPWDMFEFECLLERHIDKLTLDEIAIVSMSFFKTQKPIKGTFLLSNILYKLIDETKTVNEITLTAILKVIRFSQHLPLVDVLIQLLNKLVPEIDRISLLTCVHIALTGTNAQFFHPEIMTKISQKFVNNISKTRLKDLERLTFSLTLYNFEPKTSKPIYEEVLKELLTPEKQAQVQKYPRSFVSLVQFLTLKQIYNYELINKILDPSFLKSTYGDNRRNIGREILFLDTSLTVDCPDYKGHRLDDKLRNQLTKWSIDWVPKREDRKLSVGDKLILNILETLEIIQGGESYVHINQILPHFQRPDIIVSIDKNGNPVNLSSFKQKDETRMLGTILYPGNIEDKWFAIIAASWNSFVRGTFEPTGILDMKIKQLRKIGYIPVVIPWREFIYISQQEKEMYLKNKLR